MEGGIWPLRMYYNRKSVRRRKDIRKGGRMPEGERMPKAEGYQKAEEYQKAKHLLAPCCELIWFRRQRRHNGRERIDHFQSIRSLKLPDPMDYTSLSVELFSSISNLVPPLL